MEYILQYTDDEIPPVQHLSGNALGLKPAALPHSVIDVLMTLTRAGFEAYIVGGGVRDSLLGLTPKDFDAATNATPSQIKALFGGRCRIIGRRFQLAHVYSGQDMIEVATFRTDPKERTNATSDGMITRDNVWGTIAEDCVRRDFSINALYYDPLQNIVQDFCGAIDDIAHKRLRLLGNAKKRIEEDPVRLLRALRFKAKLGFDFNKTLSKQFRSSNWALLKQVSAHRLYDETQKMFTGGYLTLLLPLLYEYGAMPSLVAYADDAPTPLMMHIASNTDERLASGLGANPAFFYAALLWESYLHTWQALKIKWPAHEAKVKAAAQTIEHQRQKTAIPRFAESFISDIWLLQSRLSLPHPSDIEPLLQHPRFRAAYDFLVAREQADTCQLADPTNEMGKWWARYQLLDAPARKKIVASLFRNRKKSAKAAKVFASHELDQLLQLSSATACRLDVARPLFEASASNKTATAQPPVFAKVDYDDAYFAQLLNNEPLIPARRQYRRPSSHLSVKERQSHD